MAAMGEGREAAVWGALRRVATDPALARVEATFLGHNASEYGTWVAILVYAYAATGAASVGLVAAAQILPAAAVSPLVGSLGDRYGRLTVQRASYALQAMTLTATGLTMALGVPAVIVYVAGATFAVSTSAARPLQAALLPGLARSPADLTAANAVSGIAEATGILVGPLLAGLILAATGPAVVFFAAAVLLVGMTAALPTSRAQAEPEVISATLPRVDPAPGAPSDAVRRRGPRADHLAGLRAVATRPSERRLAAVLFGRDLVLGGLDVLLVIFALDVLRLGDSGPGYLNAVLGLGGIAGGSIALGLVGGRGLPRLLVITSLGWAGPILFIAGLPGVVGALPALALAGLSVALIDVIGRTLIQRFAQPVSLGAVFGAIDGLNLVAVALGSVAAGALVEVAGVGGAFAVAGLCLPLLCLVAWPGLARAEAAAFVPLAEIRLLRALPLFAPLPPPAIEGAARRLRPVIAPAGSEVIREGAPGDDFYVIVRGSVEVGQGGRELRRLAAGEGFGEIALLRPVPRTATVTALEETELLALARDDFLLALTGTVGAIDEANRAAEGLLEGDRRRLGAAET